MSLLNALFGSSKPKKDQRSASISSLPPDRSLTHSCESPLLPYMSPQITQGLSVPTEGTTPAKAEQDFVVLQDSDFRGQLSPQGTPYPNIGGMHISQHHGAGGPSSLPVTGPLDTLPRQSAIDRVPFKLDSKLSSEKVGGDQTWKSAARSINEIGSRIEEYAYDFKLERTVLNE